MIGYKLVRLKKDGNITSLFINKKVNLFLNQWMNSKCIPTKGFSIRAGWHILAKPNAPHLSKNGRVWIKVKFKDYYKFNRPKSQGGLWFLAKKMKILEIL